MFLFVGKTTNKFGDSYHSNKANGNPVKRNLSGDYMKNWVSFTGVAQFKLTVCSKSNIGVNIGLYGNGLGLSRFVCYLSG